MFYSVSLNILRPWLLYGFMRLIYGLGTMTTTTYSCFMSLSTIFHLYRECVWNREFNAHSKSSVSLIFHAIDTWHNISPSHIIPAPRRPDLALFCFNSERQSKKRPVPWITMWYDSAEDRTHNLTVTKRTLYQRNHCACLLQWGARLAQCITLQSITLRKHAYSNILKIFSTKKWKFSD